MHFDYCSLVVFIFVKHCRDAPSLVSAQEICCVEEKIANIRGVDVQWRGRRHCGGGADEVTQELRVIQARLEAIETVQRRGVQLNLTM